MTLFPSLGICPRCALPLVDAATPGFAECPRCLYTKQLPPLSSVAGASRAGKWPLTPSVVGAAQGAIGYVTCPQCGWVTDPITAQSQGLKGCWGACPKCGHVFQSSPLPPPQTTPASTASTASPYPGFAKQTTQGMPAAAAIASSQTSDPADLPVHNTQPLDRRDSAVEAFATDVRAALDTVLGPKGAKPPTPTRALDGIQETFSELFTTLDITHLEDYQRDEATLDAGGELVAKLAAWGMALMAALYARSDLLASGNDGDGRDTTGGAA